MTTKYTNKKRREVIKLSASFLIALLFFSACKKEITTIGANINPNGLNIVKQDTFTVVTSSVIDSTLKTDETIVNLLGAINDPEMGKIDCGIVTELRLSSEAPDFGNPADITVDSVVLSFVYNANQHYGDLTELSLEVLEITTPLSKDEDYYRDTEVTTTGNNLIIPGKETQMPRPQNSVFLADDTLQPMLRLNLTTAFGDYIINNASELVTNESFLSFFNGFYIKATNLNSLGANEGAVLYLDLLNALSNMVLYYDLAGDKKRFTFNINSNCARFNKIDFDYSGTPLEAALTSEEFAQEKVYLQGSHLRSEFFFPHIQKLGENGKVVINRVELLIPVQDFGPSPFNPSDALFIGRALSKDVTFSTADYPSSSNSFPTVSYNSIDNFYSFNLTRDLQRVIAGEIPNVPYRLFPRSYFGSTIERTVFSGPNSVTKNKTKLIITYTEY